jgi:hypothetical protein
MKLWLKQTLIPLTVILLSVSLCLYLFVAKESDGLIQQAIQNGERDTSVFCDHLSTLDRTSSTSYDADGVARQSLIQYTFSTYAHLLQSGDCSWSLVMDGRYFYNTAVHDPLNVLPMAEEIITASRIVETGGTHLLISAQNMTVLQTPVTVYRTANIDETYRHIDDLTRMAQLSLLGCLLLCGVLLPLCQFQPTEAPALPNVTEDAAYDDLMHAAGLLENGVRANVRDVLAQLKIHEYDVDVQTACSREEGSVSLTSLTIELGEAYANRIADVKEALGEYQEVLIVRVKGT